MIHLLLEASPTGGMSSLGMWLPMIAIIAVFYFFMIRPQQKRQKELQRARDAMQTGDKVVTAGGIHGRIKEVGDTWFLVEVADGVRIKFDKSSVFATAADANSR